MPGEAAYNPHSAAPGPRGFLHRRFEDIPATVRGAGVVKRGYLQTSTKADYLISHITPPAGCAARCSRAMPGAAARRASLGRRASGRMADARSCGAHDRYRSIGTRQANWCHCRTARWILRRPSTAMHAAPWVRELCRGDISRPSRSPNRGAPLTYRERMHTARRRQLMLARPVVRKGYAILGMAAIARETASFRAWLVLAPLALNLSDYTRSRTAVIDPYRYPAARAVIVYTRCDIIQ